MSNLKILLTGSTGFIGRNIKEKWEKKYNIYAPTRSELDLLDSQAVEEYLKKEKFDVVLHTANTNDFRDILTPYEILDRNLRMFYNLEKNAKYYGRMFYFGSGAEYSSQHYEPKMKEEYFGTYLPTDPYGFAKYTMSRIAEKSDNIYDLRLFGVYGKYEQWQRRFISNAICRSIKGMPITISQNVYFDYLHVDDLCQIVETMLVKDLQYHNYNVCNGKVIDLKSIAELVNQVTGLDRDIIIAQEGFKREYSGDVTRLCQEIGTYNTTDLKVGITQLYQYYCKNIDMIKAELLV